MEYIVGILIVLLCLISNRLRGTGVIKHFGTLNVGDKKVDIKFNGNLLYGLVVSGMFTAVGGIWLGLAVFAAYLIGEAKGWGEWVGSLSRVEPWTEKHLNDDYNDDEGKTFPFIHQIANFFIKERIDGTFEQRALQYKRYATLALSLRGMYWWLPVFLVLAGFGLISFGTAAVAGILLGIMFPIACELGKRWKYDRVYDLHFIKLSFSRGWENQEAIYGAFQGIAIAIIILWII